MSEVVPTREPTWRDVLTREEIDSLLVTDNLRGWVTLFIDWGIIAAAFALVAAAPNALTVVIALWKAFP